VPVGQRVTGVDATEGSRPCIEVSIPAGADGLAALLGPLAAAIDGSGPAVALVPGSGSSEYRERIVEAVRPGDAVPASVAVVASTSGSTGRPAGVLLPGAALRAAARGFAQRSDTPRHVWVAALPLHHAGGLMVAVRAVVATTLPEAVHGLGGSAPFTVESFLDATERAIRRGAADGFPLAVSLVPTMAASLARAGSEGIAALQAYDAVLVGGAGTSDALARTLRDAGVRLRRSYGMTETCGGAVFDGRPLPGMSVDAGPGGRLRLTGAQVALGYRDGRQPERWSLDEAGRRSFLTDDLGQVSEHGEVRVLGRLDDVVQVGGASVSLGAVADVLRADTRVAAAEAVALPDERLGAVLVAFVVPVRGACSIEPAPDDGSRRKLADILAEGAATQLGRSGRPRHVRLVPEIPMLASGKPDRQALTRLAAELVAQQHSGPG
jgi:O-succinylbenzoic acid--CoA ligase